MTNRQRLILATLDTLYTAADRPTDASALALRLGSTPVAVAEALVHLERRGLADASRVRLTLAGLAAAAALQAAAVPTVLAA